MKITEIDSNEKVKEILLQDEIDDYFTDFIIFDNWVELNDIKNTIKSIKEKNPDYCYNDIKKNYENCHHLIIIG